MQTKLEEMKELAQNFIQKTDEFIAQMDKEKPKTNERWKPEKCGEIYYIISASGNLATHYWYNMTPDIFHYNSGNCFKTEQEAQKHLENIKTKNELRTLAEELNGDKVIDWNDQAQPKYALVLSNYKKINYKKEYTHQCQGQIYSLSEQFEFLAIERIGEERLINMIKSGV